MIRFQKYAALALAGSVLLFACSKPQQTAQAPTSDEAIPAPLAYPQSPEVAQADDYHGSQVSDPYRWLEDMESEQVKSWVQAQNDLSFPYLGELPMRETYKERLTALWSYERYFSPYEVNGTTFFFYNDGSQNHNILRVIDEEGAQARTLIDPNTFSEDGTVSLSNIYVSPDASLVAYTVSDGGSDWRTIRVRSVADGQDLDDLVDGIKFTGVSWSKDNSGFYYSRYPQLEDGSWDDSQPVAIYYHALGSSQADDPLVFNFVDNPTWNPYATVINEGKQLLIGVFDGFESNAIYLKDLSGDEAVTPLFAEWDGLYGYIDENEQNLFFSTTAAAPLGKVIGVSKADLAVTTIVQEQPETLQQANIVGNALFARYLKDVTSRVQQYSLAGDLVRDIEFEQLGRVTGFGGDSDADTTYFRLTNFTNPGTVYKLDIQSGESSVFRQTEVDVDLTEFVTEQVFYESKDGTRVPMFIVYKQGMQRDGSNKTLLYGYGGFNISLSPSYSVVRTAWVEQGNILAIPNLRGGGEYGREWHKAGTKLQKQNVFDDFIAAAEYLIENNFTRPEKLAVQGGSNGGLLVGAVITQRPELFAAGLPAVGVLDMLRYHTASANARAWSSDYGLSENPDEFAALYAYSPVHNTNNGVCYPATLVTTGDHDDRVVPWHSYKFAAVLQRDQACDKPVLLRVETRAGHGAGTPTWMRIENFADQWAFIDSVMSE